MNDEQFFTDHPDRQARIRLPGRVLVKNTQRAVYYGDECYEEFRSLGDHAYERRRILVWRVPRGNPYFDPVKQPLLQIPFLAYADETIEDNDETLLPLIHEIMGDALRKQG